MSVAADALPSIPIRSAVGGAIRDLLEHPVPLVAANVVWGVIAFAAWLAAMIAPPIALVLAILLAFPAVATAGVAGRLVRGADATLGDALRWPLRRPAVPVLGAVAVLAGVVALVDIRAALERGDPVGVAFATLAAWGLVALGVVCAATWPLLGDPRRAGQGTVDILGLAVRVVLARTPRMVATCVVVGILLAVSAVLAAALLTLSVSLAALVLARVVLPIADTLEAGPL